MICPIDGVILRELKRLHDTRGWLIELFRHDEMSEESLPAMGYLSMTKPGIARGPHEHADQADYFCFVGPSTFRLYLWDNRTVSRTYQLSFRIDVGEERPTAVIVPKGVVHAYKNIGDRDGVVINAPNRLYAGRNRSEAVDEIRHEADPNSPFKLDE